VFTLDAGLVVGRNPELLRTSLSTLTPELQEELRESIRVLNEYTERRWNRGIDAQTAEDIPQLLCKLRSDLRQSIPGIGTVDDIDVALFMPLSEAVKTLREVMNQQPNAGKTTDQQEERTPSPVHKNGQAQTLDVRALALFFADKNRSKKEIADLLGKRTQSLSPERCPQLDTAMKAWRSANANARPRGSKDRDGNIEAWDEDE
jgi:hypothetical protein